MIDLHTWRRCAPLTSVVQGPFSPNAQVVDMCAQLHFLCADEIKILRVVRIGLMIYAFEHGFAELSGRAVIQGAVSKAAVYESCEACMQDALHLYYYATPWQCCHIYSVSADLISRLPKSSTPGRGPGSKR